MARWRFDRRRRKFLRVAGAAAALGPLLITERTIAQTRTLYVNTWGGSYTAAQDAAYFKPFTAATGIQIKTVTPVSYGKRQGAGAVRQLRVRHDLDQLHASGCARAREGLAEPIDWTIVKKDTLPADAIVADGYGIASEHPRHQPVLPHRQISERRPEILGRLLGREEVSRQPRACASATRRAPDLRAPRRRRADATSSIRSISTARSRSSTRSSRTSRCGGAKATSRSSCCATARST